MSHPYNTPNPEPRATPVTAAIRHPFLFILPIIVLAAAGAALGLARTPTYTTESRVSVTRLDVQTQALPGYAQAAKSLAARTPATCRAPASSSAWPAVPTRAASTPIS